MPNKQLMEILKMNDFNPHNWKKLDKSSQDHLNFQFGYMIQIDNERRLIMENFWPENWRELEEDEKLKVCQKLENNLSLESERHPYKILPYENCTSCDGITLHDKRIIKINLEDNIDNPYNVLTTVVHESCHADQHELIKLNNLAQEFKNCENINKKNMRACGLNKRDLLIMDWERFYYLDEESKLYSMQLMEVEAVTESTKFLQKYSEYMKNEKIFMEFLEDEKKNLNEIKESFTKEELVKEWFMDRRERFKSTNPFLYDRQERNQLKSLYSLNDMKDIRSEVLIELERWGKEQKKNAQRLTLDDLMKKNNESQKAKTKPVEQKPPEKEKKIIFGMSSHRL